MKKIGIVIPCHNESKNLPELIKELDRILQGINYQFYYVLVNDGSKDSTWETITSLHKNSSQTIGINFSRNFGHQAALEAGLQYCSDMDAVISMDADFQHPPEIVPQLIKHWEEGYEIVNTERKDDEKISWFKRFTSQTFYKVLNKISEIEVSEGSSDFRLLDKKAVEVIINLKEKDKFYRGIVNWVGFRVKTLPFLVGKRLHGKSSYTLKRMLRLAQAGVLSFSLLPMKLMMVAGLFTLVLSVIIFMFIFFQRFIFGNENYTTTSLLVVTNIMGTGVIVFMLGILAFYQTRMFKELQNRPNFIIRDILED